MTAYTNPFTGQTIQPSSVGYEYLAISANTTLSWSINGLGGNVPTAASIINVSASAANLALLMPPAYQVSNGQDSLINNVGSYSVTIQDNSGNTIATVAPGAVEYIYLTDNTTTNGTWAAFTFGTGTSSANAGTLAGAGLTAIGNTLNQSYNPVAYYSSTTLATSARATFALWSSGAGTLTLPSSSTVGANWFVNIRNNGTGVLTVAPSGGDLIDGNSNKQLQLTESAQFVSTGSGWNTFAYGRSNTFAYTLLSLNVTGGTTTLTAAQAANQIQEYTGTLTSNQVIIVPQTVQLYFITNLCTNGSYTFTVKTSAGGGAYITMTSNSSLVLACDGTNVFNAASGASNTFASLILGNGSAAAPSLNFVGDSSTGLYLPTTGTFGIAASGVSVAQLSTSQAYFPYGIQGGQF
jgi:hypothetical protein